MKVGSLDHDGERETEGRRERAQSTLAQVMAASTQREREREAQRVMRMAARKLLQHDGAWRHRGGSGIFHEH